jgi:hypothetical protein
MRMYVYVVSSKCPLTLLDREVWSAIVYLNKVCNRPATVYAIQYSIGRRDSTILQSIATLSNVNLCSPDGSTAYEPTGEVAQWFYQRRTNKVSHWADKLAYDVIEYGEDGLRPLRRQVLALVAKMLKRHKTTRWMTSQGKIAKMLGCGRTAINKAMAALRDDDKAIDYQVLYKTTRHGNKVPKGIEVWLVDPPPLPIVARKATSPPAAPTPAPPVPSPSPTPGAPRTIRQVLLAAGYRECQERLPLCECHTSNPTGWRNRGRILCWVSREDTRLAGAISKVERLLLAYPTDRIAGWRYDYDCPLCKRRVQDVYSAIEVCWAVDIVGDGVVVGRSTDGIALEPGQVTM